MRRIAILAVAIAAITLPATAHAFLEKASPAAGENLHAAPAKIALHFSEKLEPAFSNVAVTNAAGADMRAGPPTISGGDIDQPLKPLEPGRYRVSWHAVSVDTHRTAGKYNFLVLP